MDKIIILLSDATFVTMTLQYVETTFNILTSTRCEKLNEKYFQIN